MIDDREELNKERKEKTKMSKTKKVIILTIIILLVFTFASKFLIKMYIKNLVKDVQYENTVETPEEKKEELKEKVEGESKEEFKNIALLGIDSREDDYGLGNRSDCIMIARINMETKKVKLYSVYRDTYLKVKENGVEKLDKVNHAYAYGGAKNTMEALNKNLDINVKKYITVNFDSLIEIVNKIGGVEIDLDSSEIKYLNQYIDGTSKSSGVASTHINTPGKHNLDGVQAVAYSRIRYTAGGDYKRAERMRNVVEAIVDKSKTLNPIQLYNLIKISMPRIRTNMSADELSELVPDINKVEFHDSIGFPYEVKGKTMDRWYGVPVTLESNVERLHKEIYEKPDYVPSETVKEISREIVNKTGYR